jgi:hypothetical protein
MNVGPAKAPHDLEEPSTQAITTIGLDIAKSALQVHGVDAAAQVISGPVPHIKKPVRPAGRPRSS